MSLFFQQNIDEDTKLGVWRIEEEEAFFMKQVAPQRLVTHPHKKLQHLAGRYLLTCLFPGFPTDLIRIAVTRKPFLEDEAYHFSISHCGDFAAALVSKTKRAGVDAELVTEKVARIQHKFISEEERMLVNGMRLMDYRELTVLWSCKEAVFKWYGRGEVDFKKHIVVQKIKPLSAHCFATEICFQKEEPVVLTLVSYLLLPDQKPAAGHPPSSGELVLSYLVT